MESSFQFDLAKCNLVNYLWPHFVDKLGLEKAQAAVRQALDLQLMNGSSRTLPILFFETCGVALARKDQIRQSTGITCNREGMILIFSSKENVAQLLQET